MPATEGDLFGLQLVLLLGHNGGADGEYTEAQLRRGWRLFRDGLMAQAHGGRAGERPWAHWALDLGEEEPADPADRAIRLAELGELHDDEVATVRESARAAQDRLDRGEHVLADVPGAVVLWERVEQARR